jgi:hypothetical protein
MPDISMCEQSECPKAKRCYRFMVTPNPYRQSYIDYEFNENGCDSFSEWTPDRDSGGGENG